MYAGSPSEQSEPDPLGWVEVEGGLVEIGHDGDGFSFDNELPGTASGWSRIASPTG